MDWLAALVVKHYDLFTDQHRDYSFYISQLLNALGDALYEPVFDSEYAEQVASDPCAGWAFFNGTTSIFSGVASMIGGIIATHFGFDILLYCVMAFGTLSFMLIVYYTRANAEKEPLAKPVNY